MLEEKKNNITFIIVMVTAILLGNYLFADSKPINKTCAPTQADGNNAPCPCGG